MKEKLKIIQNTIQERFKMRIFGIIVLSILVFACQESKVKVEKIKSKFDSIVLTDSVFTGGIEGPAMNSRGDLFIVNFKKQGTIGVLKNGKDTFELFVELPNSSIGNGIRFDIKGNMFIADYVNHNVLKIEKGTKHVSVFAHNDSINQPNDIAVHANGFGFASDPNWAKGTGNLLFFKEGEIKIVESGMGTTNGVEVSPDGKKLYVNESVQTQIWVYDIAENGALSNKQLFIDFEGYGMDGMRCDSKGNLYLARYGAGLVVKMSPEGKVIKEFKLNGEKPTNVTFLQDSDKKIFVTMQEKKWVELISLP